MAQSRESTHWSLLLAVAAVAFTGDESGVTGEVAAAAAMMMWGWRRRVMAVVTEMRKTESEAGAILR